MSKPALAAAAVLSLAACAATSPKLQDLDFSRQTARSQSAELNGRTVRFRAYEGIVYVKKPVDGRYQRINIYIPEAYYQGGSVDGFTAETAPVFFPNQVGGYMPAEPGKPGIDGRSKQPNAILVALSKGYVVASPGARGRTETDGKAPAAIVDLKAAVRYLRSNDYTMPGNAGKIISNGTSAGGALSALLGASGNSPDYEPYLQRLGAAEARDDVFAVSAYCPITNLENADAAYEWQFNGVNGYTKINIAQLDYRAERRPVSGTLTPEQVRFSDELKPLFSDYVNSLGLTGINQQPLTLDKQGEGNFKTYFSSFILASAQKELDAGKKLGRHKWLTVKNGKAAALDFAAYARDIGRQKAPPAFDGVDLGTAENQLFGSAEADKQHFTDFSQANSTVSGATRADARAVKMMNPMPYIGQAQTAQNWRIRHGTHDRDTSPAIPLILATKLKNSGKTVNFAMPWNQGHGGDYDLEELFAWAKQVSAGE